MSGKIRVEVVYALPLSQDCVELQLDSGCTVQEAIYESGILSRHPEITQTGIRVGIFGRRAPLDASLGDGDRVEIYRALQIDPKEVRRQRASNRPAKR
jgi:putative ubiquitin-RnfH superfamily antitoxin RatB of RatAB toxin-antitoxin module